jgi:hypothetical protein
MDRHGDCTSLCGMIRLATPLLLVGSNLFMFRDMGRPA